MDSSHLLHQIPHAAALNNALHQSSPSAAGPQIRSRITVVCAECKRLKLKCDRRAPCGSCTKRDTVARCIYSPAAAEKVDLHSLNNRLIQVEAILAMITAGQNPPAFQSSYPISFQTNAQPSLFTYSNASQTHGLHQHQHHHHYAAPPPHLSATDSFALAAHDITSIWLPDLDLGLGLRTSSPHSPFHLVPDPSGSGAHRPRAFSNAENTGLIKLEPSPIDIELSRPQPPPQTNNVIDVDCSSSSARSTYPSRAPSPLKRNPYPPRTDLRPPFHQRRPSTQMLLPALSIYYPIPAIPPQGTTPASSAAFPRHMPTNHTPASPSTSPASGPSATAGYALPSSQPQYTKPQVTPALLGLLPPVQTCRRLLACAREVLRVRPIPFEPVGAGSAPAPDAAWHAFESRCIALLDIGTSKEKEKERERKEREREKAREAKRAREIYFGGKLGMQPHQDAGTDMDVDGDDGGRGRNSHGHAKTSRAGADSASASSPGDEVLGEGQSLTFFALMCAVLALGSSMSPPPPLTPSSSSQQHPKTTPASPMCDAGTPAFLYALSQQALGVWDTHHTGLAAGLVHPHPSAAALAAEETEKLDFLLACVAGLGYLLLTRAPGRDLSMGAVAAGDEEGGSEREGGAGSGLESGSSAPLIYNLVGKLVNAARGMGLGRDASVLSSVLSRKEKQRELAADGRHAGSSGVAGASNSSSNVGTTGASGVALGKGPSKREREAERERIREEWKKMIWWEVLFYDLFTADALGHQPYIPAHLFGVKLPACASLPQSPSMMAPAPAVHGDEQESDEDGSRDGDRDSHRDRDRGSNRDMEGGSGMRMQQDGVGFRREKSRTHSAAVFPASPASDAAERAEEEYLGARYSLTQLAQTIKNRLLHPDCCCGYTLDQAAVLEAEIRRWQAALPASLKWVEEACIVTPALVPAVAPGPEVNANANASPAVISPFASKSAGVAERVKVLQRSELAVMANVLLMKVYTPFLRQAAGAKGILSDNGNSSSSASSITASAAHTTVLAAHTILKAAKDIYTSPASFSSTSQSLLSTSLLSISISSSPTSSSSPSASPGKTVASAAAAVSPSMFDLYPLDKLVFDAAVVCAHAAPAMASRAATVSSLSPLPLAVLANAPLFDDVIIALEWLLGEQTHGSGAGDLGSALGDEQRKIADALYKKVLLRAGAHHGMKRKYSQVELNTPFGPTSAVYQQSANNSAANPQPEHDWNSVTATQVNQYQQPPAVVELPPSSPSVSRSSMPPLNFPQDNIMRAEQQKQDLASAVRLAVAARGTEKGDDGKEKKYAKKEKSSAYPSVGVRVRPNKDREHSSRASRKHSIPSASGGNPQPLMTSTPRALPTAEAVLAYQQQKQQKLLVTVQPTVPQPPSTSQSPSVMYDQDLGRSRSSSINHLQAEHAQQHQQNSSQSQSQHPDVGPEDSRYSYFGAHPLEAVDMQMHRKRFSIHEQQPHPQPHQPHHQQTQSPQQPFTTNMYDQGQGQSHVMYEPQPYDNVHGTAGAGVDVGYSAVSSPFSNSAAPTSSSGSPFASTSALSSGHPPTPTFPPHHPSAPVFGPQPPVTANSSPTAYFHTPSFVDSSYPNSSSSSSHMPHQHQQQHSSQQNISLTGMGMDQAIISIPSAPQSSYEKQPQQLQTAMYDMKPNIEHHQTMQPQQMQQHQPMNTSFEEHDISGQRNTLSLGMPGSQTWSNMGQQQQQTQQQQEQQPPPPNSQPFWNNGQDYRFYP